MSSYKWESEDAAIIPRLAAIVEKEQPIDEILKIVRKYKTGISREKLLLVLKRSGYQEKVMHQLAYFGLIVAAGDGGSSYHITEKGRRVLEACKQSNCRNL
jgi:predicted transcriptional regulator